MTHPSTTPAGSTVSPKVKAAAAASAVATAVAAVAALFGADVEVTEEGLAGLGALLTLATFAAGYLKRDPLRR